MKKTYIVMAILCILLLPVASAQFIPDNYYRIYMRNGGFLWTWQIEYKTDEFINDTRGQRIKQRIIDSIGIRSFYDNTYTVVKSLFRKTGYLNRLPNILYCIMLVDVINRCIR